ncbi:MAG: sulfotransferase family protein [Notoacmeibacter sp.]|nr:sulfotransferase family protein [Notoacmeibacter sp.]
MMVPTHRKQGWFSREKENMLFVHVPKCGGKFVERVFQPWIRKCPSRRLEAAAGHLRWSEYNLVFSTNGIDIAAMTSFAVVRNPWDWHVSWFHYIRQDGGGRRSGHALEAALFRRFSFSDYVDWLEDDDAPASPQNYIKRQIKDYLTDENGDIAVAEILRQESLEDDLRGLAKKYDLAIRIGDGRINSSERESYRKYYSDLNRERIGLRHKDDLHLFGYEF